MAESVQPRLPTHPDENPDVLPGVPSAVAAALPLPADSVQNAALLQPGYDASIASFLAGVHWGMAMSGSRGTRPVT